MWGTAADAEEMVIRMMQTIVELWKKAELDARNAEGMMERRLNDARKSCGEKLGDNTITNKKLMRHSN